MKISVLLILAVMIITPFNARSQNEGVKSSSTAQGGRTSSMNEINSPDLTVVKEYEQSGGSPGNYMVYDQSGMYLEPGWSPGYVMLKDKTRIDEIKLRYDLYHQQMQFVRKGDTLAFKNPGELDYLYMGNRKFVYCDYNQDGVINQGFFEVLHEGKCPLYLHRSIRYHLDPEDRPSLSQDVYIRQSDYYILKDNQMAEMIKLTRKGILNTFQDKEAEVAGFMNDNNLSGKTCDELKLVIAFYNSLE
jgi:hypothetical protein